MAVILVSGLQAVLSDFCGSSMLPVLCHLSRLNFAAALPFVLRNPKPAIRSDSD